jgi:AraC family transcriptional regulator
MLHRHAGRTLVRGRVPAGAAQITAPGVPCRAVFESPVGVLCLFVSDNVLTECFEDLIDRPRSGVIRIDDANLVRDLALEPLGEALAVAHSDVAALGKLFTDSVSLAIVSRVVARHFTAAHRTRGAPGISRRNFAARRERVPMSFCCDAGSNVGSICCSNRSIQ